MSVILAETKAIFRRGAARVLRAHPGVEVAHECENLAELEAALPQAGGAVVLFGLDLSANPAALAARIDALGGFPVLVLPSGSTAAPALAKIVPGILPQSAAAADLIACVERVAAGRRWRPAKKEAKPPAPETDTAGQRVLAALTPKELSIVALVASGGKNREIAHLLETTEQVVKNYLRSIYDKTGVSDRLELSLYVYHHRVIAEAVEEALKTIRP